MFNFDSRLNLDEVLPLAALLFLALCVVLTIISVRASARRRARVRQIVIEKGLVPIDPMPKAAHLVPTDLFRHLGQAPRDIYHNATHVLDAWKVPFGSLDVVLFEAKIHRVQAGNRGSDPNAQTASAFRFGSGASTPPDFLVSERVLLKSQVRGHLQVAGKERIGKHYYVFSTPGVDELALRPWLNDEVLSILEQQRFWKIAAHDGVLFVARGLGFVRAADYRRFLEEGEHLVRALADRG